MAETVKLEIDHQSLCHGCLSQGRKTVSIPPGELSQMFLYLVTTQVYTGVEATKLCWECMAMLRRFIEFRDRLLHAQNTLMMLYHMNTSISTLSNLTTDSKVDFDQSFEFISELPTQDKNLEQNVELEIIKTEEVPDFDQSFEFISELPTQDKNLEQNEELEIIKTEEVPDFDQSFEFISELPTQDKNLEQNEELEIIKTEEVPDFDQSFEFISELPTQDKNLEQNEELEIIKTEEVPDFDQSFEFISELPTQDKNLEQNVELEIIKTEKVPDGSIKELNIQNTEENIDYKVENDSYNVGFDSDTNTNIEITEKAKKKQYKKMYKRFGKQLYDDMKRNFRKHAIVKTMNTNWGDEKNYSQYFSDEYLDENQIYEFMQQKTNRRRCVQKCKDCNKKFYVKIDYLRHRNLNHRNGQPDICLLCKKKFPSLEQLQLHWKNRHSCYSRCNMCHMYCNKRAQKKHLNYYHTKLYCCDECGEQLLSPLLFKKHYKKYHATFICDYCGKNFNFKRTLLKHILANHSDHHKCEICHKEFRRKRNLVTHLTRHHELSLEEDREASYCVECDRQYPSLLQYRRHLKVSPKHRPLPVKSIPCPECGKIFRRTTYMRNHLYLTHMKEKAKHFCELCGKYFTTNGGLKVHYNNVHQKLPKPKNDICDLCGRAFSSKRILTHHRRTHTGERPHACQFCSAAFAQKAALQSHQKSQHRDMLNSKQDKVNS